MTHHEQSDNSAERVDPETLHQLEDVLASLASTNGIRRDMAFGRFPINYTDGKPQVDWSGSNGGYVGSGYMYDVTTNREYEVWTRAESGEPSYWDIDGERVQLRQYIHEQRSNSTGQIVSRSLVTTTEGRVFEIDEGVAFSETPPTVQELNNTEVQDFTKLVVESEASMMKQSTAKRISDPYSNDNY